MASSKKLIAAVANRLVQNTALRAKIVSSKRSMTQVSLNDTVLVTMYRSRDRIVVSFSSYGSQASHSFMAACRRAVREATDAASIATANFEFKGE